MTTTINNLSSLTTTINNPTSQNLNVRMIGMTNIALNSGDILISNNNPGIANKIIKPKKPNSCTLLTSRKSIIVSAVLLVFLVWILFFLFQITYIIYYFVGPRFNLTIIAEGYSLVRSNLQNSSSYIFNCTNELIFSNEDHICLPPCSWHPYTTDVGFIRKLILIVLNFIGLIVGFIALIIWSSAFFFNFNEYKLKLRNKENRNPAKFSLYMVICHSVLLAGLDLGFLFYDYRSLYCRINSEGEYYLPIKGIVYNQPGEVQHFITLWGSLFFLIELSMYIWTSNAFLSLIYIVAKPLKSQPSKCSLAIGLYLLMVLETVIVSSLIVGANFTLNFENPISTFGISFLYLTILPVNILGSYFFYKIPTFFITSLITTLAILIIAKLRLKSYIVNSVATNQRNLTPIERRIFAYGIVMSLFLYFGMASSAYTLFSESSYTENLNNYISCVSNKSLSMPNMTEFSAFQRCQPFVNYFISAYPNWFSTLIAFAKRLFWLSSLVVVFPNCALFNCYQMYKKYKNKRIRNDSHYSIRGLPVHSRIQSIVDMNI